MNKPCLKWRISRVVALVLLVTGFAQASHASRGNDSAPDWVRQVVSAPLPQYPKEADAVVLLDDETLTVQPNGDMYKTYRRVVKILRPGGKHYGKVIAYFDKDTKLDFYRAWSISAGQEYALKDKDATEVSPYDYVLYSDTRYKVMELPAVDVGAYVAFEYQQHLRPLAFNKKWYFQERAPVHVAKFTIQLPPGWEYEYRFGNWAKQKPKNIGGNNWQWEVDEIPGMEDEAAMPPMESLLGMMVVSFFSASLPKDSRMESWNDVGRWADSLNAGRRNVTPKMQQQIAQLIAGKTETTAKVEALAQYVQRHVRYVAIEIGIGGFQAHMAGDTFANSYGDCKDKATLLVTMLREIGIEAYLALVDSERGVVNPAMPSPWAFNHAIVAVKLPQDARREALYARIDDPKLGSLLFVDPTSELTPFGWLPAGEQDSYALVVTSSGGVLVKMPVLAPNLNRTLRVAHLQLTPQGGLMGDVEETRYGHEAATLRSELLAMDKDKRVQFFERYLSRYLDQSRLTFASIGGLDKFDDPLILRYKFEAADYAKLAGDLMLVRPRVIGGDHLGLAEEKKARKYPVSYATTSLRSDIVDIKLPQGYTVDELPDAADVKAPFAEYKSKIEAKDNVLYYNRSYTVKDLTVPVEEMSELKTFMRGVAADERSTAVLKKSAP